MTGEGGDPQRLMTAVGKTLVQLVVSLAMMGLLLFVPAGTLDWPRGWWFLGVFTVMVVLAIAFIFRVNPELFEARQGFKPGSKGWDVVIASILIVCMAAILPVAALDDARFHWLPVPAWVTIVGYVLFIGGFVVTGWAQAVNRHFEMGVRIQSDRGHRVIDTGPYSIIRHPGYSGAIVLCIGMALALGSIVALIPVLVVVLVLAYRTLLEEQTLSDELPGYAAYMDRVPSRWIPRVW